MGLIKQCCGGDTLRAETPQITGRPFEGGSGVRDVVNQQHPFPADARGEALGNFYFPLFFDIRITLDSDRADGDT